MDEALEALVAALATHLTTITGLTVLKEFPAANQVLTYPSVTITSGKPEFANFSPYQHSQTEPTEEFETTTVLIVGACDAKLQLDLWCRNKKERRTMLGLLFAKLNPDVSPMGLSLQLTAYHDLWARVDFIGQEFLDDEGSAQRQEWRTKLDLLANMKVALSKEEYSINTIENNLTTPDTIEAE